MCFSPEASFIGGTIILSIGVATIKQVQKTPKMLFALIPVFFGIQQIAEGFVWLSIQNPEFFFLRKFSTNIFLIMALIIWPALIPIAVYSFEENKKNKKRFRLFISLGIFVSVYFTFCLMFFDIQPQISHFHIEYKNDFPKSFAKIAFALYLLATIVPMFISSVKKMHYFGVLLFLSCLISAVFFKEYLTSVWCFFAAFISVVIYFIVRDTKTAFVMDERQEEQALSMEKSKIK